MSEVHDGLVHHRNFAALPHFRYTHRERQREREGERERERERERRNA